MPTPGSGPRKNSAFAIGVPPCVVSSIVAVTAATVAARVGLGAAWKFRAKGPWVSPVGEYVTESRGRVSGSSGHPCGNPVAHPKMLTGGAGGPALREGGGPRVTPGFTPPEPAGGGGEP